jgi:hypothetical protein
VNQVTETTNEQKRKRKRAPLFVVLLLAGTGFFLARGVAAGPQNTITLNGATQMMGGDEIAGNACDASMTITRTPVLASAAIGPGVNFMITRVSISGVNQNAPSATAANAGVEGCGNQILQMAIYNGSLTGASKLQQASWTIPSAAITNGTFYFDIEQCSNGNAYYADVCLNSFDAAQITDTKYAVHTYRTPY